MCCWILSRLSYVSSIIIDDFFTLLIEFTIFYFQHFIFNFFIKPSWLSLCCCKKLWLYFINTAFNCFYRLWAPRDRCFRESSISKPIVTSTSAPDSKISSHDITESFLYEACTLIKPPTAEIFVGLFYWI